MEQLSLKFEATSERACAAQAGVYVLEAIGTGLVKIGFTSDIEKRLADLRFMTAAPLKLLKLFLGGRREERELHRRFHEQRSHGEWFHYAPIRSALDALDGARIEILSDRLTCIDCGAIRSEHSRMRAKRCKACEMRRRHAERQQSAQYAEWKRVRTTCMECGGAIAVDLNRGLSKTGLCKPCAMRKAWATGAYRTAIGKARTREGMRRRKRCIECGESLEPGRKSGRKYHPTCWEKLRARRVPGNNSCGTGKAGGPRENNPATRPQI